MNPTLTYATRETPLPFQWLTEHGDALYRFAILRVRKREAAEDLVQETLLAAMRGYAAFDQRSSVQTWLMGILKHKILDYIAVRSRQNAALAHLADGGEEDFFDSKGKWKLSPRNWSRQWKSDPHAIAERDEFYTILHQCIDKLPRRMAEIFLQQQMDEISTEFICKETGLTPTNVWTLLYRAKLRLRTCLSVNWFDDTKDKKAL